MPNVKPEPKASDTLKPFRLVGLVLALLCGCQSAPTERAYQPCVAEVADTGWRVHEVLADGDPIDLDSFYHALARSLVVLVGEHHARYDHHLSQLDIICRLHEQNPALAIGVEFFQQPYQAHLDKYIEGTIDEQTLLARTEYFDRWRYDFRLYADILRFARDKRIPVLALNVPSEITSKVGREGFDSLDDSERIYLPDHMMSASESYRERLQAVFDQHSGAREGDFDNFLSAQLLWDETMAAGAAHYWRQNQDKVLVVLAGNGHVAHRDAMAARIEARLPVAVTIVSPGPEQDQTNPDYRLLSSELELVPAGKLGVFLHIDKHGVRIESFSEASAAQAAGVLSGDRIVSLDGEPVMTFSDVKLQLWRKLPGEAVSLEVRRNDELLSYEFNLN